MAVPRRVSWAVCLLAIAGAVSSSGGAGWKPIDPRELAMTTPKLQPDADAEALAWEVRVADGINGTTMRPSTTYEHYLRVKIFTDRGRETFASIDIPHEDNVLVQAVAARTSLPDGSAVELRESDVHERTVVKTEGLKVKVVSFAMPAVTTGAVIEYRWREVHMDSLASHLRLPVSRSVPVHSVHYDIRPLDIPGFQMRAVPFNSDGPRPERQRDGAMRVVRLDVAADRDEPHALPPFQQRPWVFIHYASADESLDRATYWKQFSKDLFEEYARTTKPNDAIRRLAASVPGTGTVSERVAALLKLARGSVERIDVDTADPAVRRKAKENRSAADALDRGQGTGSDVRVLFMALAKAAGLEARIVAVPNRSDVFHGPDRMNGYFVRDRLVAIGSGESRMFVDPANEYAEDGALQWWAEGQEVLVADPVAVVPAPTPISPASASARQRTAELRLAADGALEGDCRAAYTGHLAMALKEQEDQDAGPEREKALRDMVLARLPGAEIADPKVENVTSATGPYVNTYRLKVRNYAEQAGSRLFLQPAVFQKGDSPRFPSAKRFGPVYLSYPWSENDLVTIELPPGWQPEQAERPVAVYSSVGRYEAEIGTSDDWRHLVFKRKLTVGLTPRILLFTLAEYPAVKDFFDRVFQNDTRTVSLRKREGVQ